MLCSTEYSSWSSCYIFICYHFQPGFLAKENKSDSLETKFKRETHICGRIKTNCWAGKMTQRVSVAAAKPDDLRPVSRREERTDSCKLSNLGCCLFSICILMPIDFQHISGKHTLYLLSDFWLLLDPQCDTETPRQLFWDSVLLTPSRSVFSCTHVAYSVLCKECRTSVWGTPQTVSFLGRITNKDSSMKTWQILQQYPVQIHELHS